MRDDEERKKHFDEFHVAGGYSSVFTVPDREKGGIMVYPLGHAIPCKMEAQDIQDSFVAGLRHLIRNVLVDAQIAWRKGEDVEIMMASTYVMPSTEFHAVDMRMRGAGASKACAEPQKDKRPVGAVIRLRRAPDGSL